MSSGSTAAVNSIVPPPPGVVPNFVNPHRVTGGVVPVSAVFLTLSTIALAIRLYTKIGIIKIFGAEDVIVIVAWIFNVLSTMIALVQGTLGNGIHMWDIPIPMYLTYMKWAAAAYVIYPPAVGLAKTAILIFYLRINPDRKFRFQVFAVLFVVVGYMVAIIFAEIFECKPIAKYWNPLIEGHCINLESLFLANAYLNVITDLMVLLVPIPMLISLHASVRQKLLIWGLVATGSLTCIISAVRIYYVTILLHSTDPSYQVPTPTALGVVETNLSIICSSLMVLRPFLRKHLPFLVGGNDDSDAAAMRQRRPSSYNNLEGRTPQVGEKSVGSEGSTLSGGSRGWNKGSKKTETRNTMTTVDELEREAKGGWSMSTFTPGKVMTSRGENEQYSA